MTKYTAPINRIKDFIDGLPEPLRIEREVAFVPEPALVGATPAYVEEWKLFEQTVAEDASRKKERRKLLCQHLGISGDTKDQDKQLLEAMLGLLIPGYSLKVKPPHQWARFWRGDLEALLLADVNLFLLDNPRKKASDATRFLAETPFWKRQLVMVSKKREKGTEKEHRRGLNVRLALLKNHPLALFARSLEKNGGFSKDVLRQYWESVRDAAKASFKTIGQ